MDKHNPVDVLHTYYATAQQCHWAHVWNVYICNSRCEVVLYKDDINSTFHREQYQPEISAAHSYVKLDWIIIAVGLIFGSCNSPGLFCIFSELRDGMTANYPGLQKSPLHHLVRQIFIPPSSATDVVAAFAQAQAVALSIDTESTESCSTHHSTFVDNNLMAETGCLIRMSIQWISGLCYLLFGHPQRGILNPSLSGDKSLPSAAWEVEQLGINEDTRKIQITYPLAKWADFLTCIIKGWKTADQRSHCETAILLSHTNTASIILLLGSYFSIRLQQ